MAANRDDVEIGVDEYNNTLKNNVANDSDDVVDIMSDLSKGVPVTQQTFDTSEEDDSCVEEDAVTPSSSSMAATKSKKKKKYAGLAIAAVFAVAIGFAVAIKKSRNDNTTMSTSALEAHCQTLYVKLEVSSSSSTYEPTPSPVKQSVPFIVPVIYSNDFEYILDDDEGLDDEGFDDEGRELRSGKNRKLDEACAQLGYQVYGSTGSKSSNSKSGKSTSAPTPFTPGEVCHASRDCEDDEICNIEGPCSMRDYQSWCENGLGKGECHWKMGYGKCMDGPNPKRTGATCAARGKQSFCLNNSGGVDCNWSAQNGCMIEGKWRPPGDGAPECIERGNKNFCTNNSQKAPEGYPVQPNLCFWAPRIFPEVVDVQKDGQCVDNGASCSRRGTAKCLNGVEAQGGVSCMLSGDYGCQDIRGRCEPHVVTSSSGKSGKSGGRH